VSPLAWTSGGRQYQKSTREINVMSYYQQTSHISNTRPHGSTANKQLTALA